MDSDIKINLNTVSRKHAALLCDENDEVMSTWRPGACRSARHRLGLLTYYLSLLQVWLKNLNSQNETLLDGKQVSTRTRVADASVINIHGRCFRFENGECFVASSGLQVYILNNCCQRDTMQSLNEWQLASAMTK